MERQVNAGGERAQTGFTLIEVLIVLVILGTMILTTMPAFLRMVHRGKLEGIARQTGGVMRLARLEAIRGAVPFGVKADFDNNRIVYFKDSDFSGHLNGGDSEESWLPLPARITFHGPGDPSQHGPNAISGFSKDATGGWVIFKVDGSVQAQGAFRFADQRGNFLETIVDPPATARVGFRKYKAGTGWLEQGEGGLSWDWE